MAALPPPPPVKSEPGSFAWMDWYKKLYDFISTAGSIAWSQIDFAGSSLINLATRLHSDLQGLQGGTSGEYYHLTAAQIAAIGTIVPVSSPVTKTADFTVAANEQWLINNKSSACVVTLPSAASFPGRELTFQNYQAFTLTSASSNVIPQGGGAAGTAILLGVVGNWATLVSNGTNWVIMQAAPNNILLLE